MGEKEKAVEQKKSPEKMMNLSLHVQYEQEVGLVNRCTGMILENDPQGVYVGPEESDLESAAEKVFQRIKKEGYRNILVGGNVGLTGRLIKKLMTAQFKEEMPEVHMFEFVHQKRRDPNTGRLLFEPKSIRQII